MFLDVNHMMIFQNVLIIQTLSKINVNFVIIKMFFLIHKIVVKLLKLKFHIVLITLHKPHVVNVRMVISYKILMFVNLYLRMNIV